MLQMSTSWSDDDAEMPMSAGHWILNWLDIVYSILDAAYFYSYFARWLLLCCAKSIGNNFSLFFHLPQVEFKVSSRGQPTRIKIIFKVRTFEVGPLLISQNATPVSLPFSLCFWMPRCSAMRLHATGGRCLRFLNALSHDCQQSNIQQQLEYCQVQWIGNNCKCNNGKKYSIYVRPALI